MTEGKASVGILGAGTWGMALARLLANSGKDVVVWSALESEIEELSRTNSYPRLPEMKLPDHGIRYTTSVQDACECKDIVLFAVPSVYVRETARKAAPFVPSGQIVVDVAKGIEDKTFKTLSEVLCDELGDDVKIVVLSGPTHAEEVAVDLPTTIMAASSDMAAADFVKRTFSTGCMKVYTSTDVRGTEICGAIKNIFALAAGISDGLGFGDNAKAAIMTLGIHEMNNLGRHLGCQPETFFGLAGLGDLIVTCMSPHSRNNRCGRLIGQGVSVDEAVKRIGMVVEGINALTPVVRMAKKYDLDMPMVLLLFKIIKGQITPRKAVDIIFSENINNELD